MEIVRLDHLVLTVANIEKSCQFYSSVLGMKEITFGENRKALQFGNQKINLHEYGNELDPKAKNPSPGSSDLCFITGIRLVKVLKHITENDVEIIEGPVRRTGAVGVIESIYFYDPDGNLIEVSNYVNEE